MCSVTIAIQQYKNRCTLRDQRSRKLTTNESKKEKGGGTVIAKYSYKDNSPVYSSLHCRAAISVAIPSGKSTRHIAEIHEATILQPHPELEEFLFFPFSLSLSSIAPWLNVHKRQLCKPRVFHKPSLPTIKQKCRSLTVVLETVISIDLSIEFSLRLINARFKISFRLRHVYVKCIYSRPLSYILSRNNRGSFVFSHNGCIMFLNWSNSFAKKINSIHTNSNLRDVRFRSCSSYIYNLYKLITFICTIELILFLFSIL